MMKLRSQIRIVRKCRIGVGLLLLIIVALMVCMGVSAQTVTPVEVDDQRPEQPVLHYYDKHGDLLPEPVLFLATLDTVQKVKSGPVYPVFNGVSVGFNFMDAVMMIAGQKYYNFNLEASVSLWNWLFPVVEFGLGKADNKPEDSNFKYVSKWSPFVKVGFDYNFLYKSNPAYKVYIGYRAGWGRTVYTIDDVTVDSGYWGETMGPVLADNVATAWYGEAVAGLKVDLWKGLGLGWSLRYRHKFRINDPRNASVWYIPGYGAGHLAATFALYWTFK